MQVLQRKTEEAAMATKRLKELLEARKSSGRDNSGISLRIATIFCIIINTPNLTALPSFSFFFFLLSSKHIRHEWYFSWLSCKLFSILKEKDQLLIWKYP